MNLRQGGKIVALNIIIQFRIEANPGDSIQERNP